MHGAPIYVRHEVVHNRFVVENLEQKGAVFVENLDEVPVGSILIFSAHGVSHEVRREAEAQQFKVFDATCPLVTKVHIEVAKMREQGREIIMIGHPGILKWKVRWDRLKATVHACIWWKQKKMSRICR